MSKNNQKIENDGPEQEQHLKAKRNLSKITTKELPEGYKRLRVQFDITYKGSIGKEPQGDSLTEPDMSLSISQLLEHHTRGKTVPTQEPQYFNMEVPTFADITDVERYTDQLRQRLKDTTKFLKEEAKIKAEADKVTLKQQQAQAYKELHQLEDTPQQAETSENTEKAHNQLKME